MILKGLASTDHPIMAHLIPIRRCNLSCTYCNEYDDFSKPLPLDTIRARIDQLADLGTSIVTLSGGEPLLHPDLDEHHQAHARRGVIAGMITNGYLLTADRIKRLNEAGLDHMQISIDNVMPDDVSKKSLKVLDKKLQLLSEHSNFHVNINSVLGGGIHNPEDALVVSNRASGAWASLPPSESFMITKVSCGRLGEKERNIYLSIKKLEKTNYSRFNWFQESIAWGKFQRVEVPRRRPLSVHLRRGSRSLLLAAARLSCQAARRVQRRRHPPRVSDGKGLRSLLHGILRTSSLVSRFLALPANDQRSRAGERDTGRTRPAAVNRPRAQQSNLSCPSAQ